jgi:aminoglycoside 3-N-acetyltransferase
VSKYFKNKLRLMFNRARLAFVRQFRSFGPPELLDAIRMAGIVSGDCIVAHCSFDQYRGFRGSLGDFIACLMEAVGPDGTLVMVSMPYTSSTLEYLRHKPRFDVLRTPSMMGLLVETFRKWPGVKRSLNPTHPILAAGRLASQLTEKHESCQYPCGPGSPFEKLRHHNAKALFVNVSTQTLTFFHYLEHLVADAAGVRLYRPELFNVPAIGADGVEITVQTYVFAKVAARESGPDTFWRWLERAKMVRHVRIGASHLASIDLAAATELVLKKSRQGEFFFGPM